MPESGPRRSTRTTVASREARGPRPVGRKDALEASRRPSQIAGDHFFRDLVGSMRNGVLAIRRDGRIAVMNGVAYRILGLTPRKSDVGRPARDVLRGVPDLARILERAFDMDTLPSRAEMRLEATNRTIGYTMSVIRDGGGRATGAVLFFKDLTRVEQLEERERLRDRLVALGEMAAAIAHEVKNPLAGIEVMAGVLRRQLDDMPDVQGVLGDIINEAKMANAIVLEVLEFVRPVRLELDPTSIRDVLTGAVAMVERLSGEDDVPVVLNLPENLPEIPGDDSQLRQVFVNLITNAHEALGAKGRVTVSASLVDAEVEHGCPSEPPRREPHLVIDVEDDGPGVHPDLAEQIFRPFYTSKPRGSGLGLAIVRKIVNAHDGRIDLAPRPAGGACFRVILPISSTYEDCSN